MSQKLPSSGFAWTQGSEWSAERVLALSDSADSGAFLEVDLAYPVELYDVYNDFLICP